MPHMFKDLDEIVTARVPVPFVKIKSFSFDVEIGLNANAITQMLGFPMAMSTPGTLYREFLKGIP